MPTTAHSSLMLEPRSAPIPASGFSGVDGSHWPRSVDRFGRQRPVGGERTATSSRVGCPWSLGQPRGDGATCTRRKGSSHTVSHRVRMPSQTPSTKRTPSTTHNRRSKPVQGVRLVPCGGPNVSPCEPHCARQRARTGGSAGRQTYALTCSDGSTVAHYRDPGGLQWCRVAGSSWPAARPVRGSRAVLRSCGAR